MSNELSRGHRAELAESGLTEAHIETLLRHGWHTVGAKQGNVLLTEDGQSEPHGDNSGLAIPFATLDGSEVKGYRIRLNEEHVYTHDGKKKTQKYAQPQSRRLGVYVPAAFDVNDLTSDDIVYIAEGEKKAEAISSLSLKSLSLTGVSTWSAHKETETSKRSLEPELVQVANIVDRIVVVYDNDIHDASKSPLKELVSFLKAMVTIKPNTRWVMLPQGEVKGIDDRLVASGPDATKAILAQWIPADPTEQLRCKVEIPRELRLRYAQEWLGKGKQFKEWLAVAVESKKVDAPSTSATVAGELAWLTEQLRVEAIQVDVCGGRLGSSITGDLYLDRERVANPTSLANQIREAVTLKLRPNGWSKKWQYSKEDVFDAMAIVAKDRIVDPVKDYLKSLQWDGTQRLNQVPEKLLGNVNSAKIEGVMLRKWMISAVARIFKPGCKVDTVLVLQGKQGLMKSTFFRVLAGEANFIDSPIDFGNKDGMSLLKEAWIFEMAELATALTARSQEDVKAFMSRASDTYRPAYGRDAVTYKRRCVLAGTTNADTFLTDVTGNRRFWPIACHMIDIKGLQIVRDQLWAEAVNAYESGEAWWLSSAEVESLEVHQAPMTKKTTIQEWLADECCEGGETSTRTLYLAYSSYLKSRSMRFIPSETAFAVDLTKQGVIGRHTRSGSVRPLTLSSGRVYSVEQMSEDHAKEAAKIVEEAAASYFGTPSRDVDFN